MVILWGGGGAVNALQIADIFFYYSGSFRVKSTNIWEIKKVHVSEIHQILTIYSPGT